MVQIKSFTSVKENSNDLNDNNELDFIDIDKRIKGVLICLF